MDLPAQSIERRISTALRLIKGIQVQAFGIDAEENRVESWQAERCRVVIQAPLTPDAGDYVARQLKSAGVTNLTVSEFQGFLSGGYATIDQMRVTGYVDDPAAERLCDVEFTFPPDELAAVDAKVHKAKIITARVNGRLSKEPPVRKPCQVCGEPIDPIVRSKGAKSCSDSCRKALQTGRAKLTKQKASQDAGTVKDAEQAEPATCSVMCLGVRCGRGGKLTQGMCVGHYSRWKKGDVLADVPLRKRRQSEGHNV